MSKLSNFQIMKRVSGFLILGALLTAAPASAQQVVFLVRHAERVVPAAGQPAPPPTNMMGDDPPLSPAGEQRAQRLAAMLASAEVRHVFTTEYKRTRQTAAPLAEKLKLTPVMSAAKDPGPLVAAVLKAKGNVLIVGHSNTVPDLIKKLGITEPIAIGDNDFDNLFVVVRSGAGNATLVRLKY
jgi:broad specificity phosphatase PhoE